MAGSLASFAVEALPSRVVALTRDKYARNVGSAAGASAGTWLLNFGAPWCGPCNAFAPVFNHVAHLLANETTVRFGKIDCEAYHDLCTPFRLQAYPHTVLLVGGSAHADTGSQDPIELAAWARAHLLRHREQQHDEF